MVRNHISYFDFDLIMFAYEIMITHIDKYKNGGTYKPFEAKVVKQKRINLCAEQNRVLQGIQPCYTW